jgi:serine/threonine-protein kinase
MKKLFALTSIFLVVLAVGCTGTGVEFSTYINSVHGLRMDYPSDWEVSEHESHEEGLFASLFMSQQENSSDNFQENVNVLVRDMSDYPITFENFTTVNLQLLEQLTLGSFTLITSTQTTLAGNEAHKIVYTLGSNGYPTMKLMQVWTVKDDVAYVITYTALDDAYSRFLATVQHMIDSLEIG